MKSILHLVRFVGNMLAIVILLILTCQINEYETRKLYGELLTNDNELYILDEIRPKTSKKPTNSAANNISKNNNNNNNNSKNDTSNWASSLTNQSNKLIVNVIYLSNDHQTETRAQSLFRLTSNNKSSKNEIVYASHANMSPCEKNPCKRSNHVCILHKNQTSITFECVSKEKLHKNVKRDLKNTISTTTTTTTAAKNVHNLNQNCKPNTYFETSLSVYDFYFTKQPSTPNLDDKLKIDEYCSGALAANFFGFDANNDSKLAYDEFSQPLERLIKTANQSFSCLKEFFTKCDSNQDSYLDKKEACECISRLRPKCASLRSSSSLDLKKIYIEQLNKEHRALSLSLNSYVPICDIDGYFKATQCDSKLTCWCVNKLGRLSENSVHKIDQNPIDCEDFVKKKLAK